MREWRQIAEVDDVGMHLQNASTTSEAIATLKVLHAEKILYRPSRFMTAS